MPSNIALLAILQAQQLLSWQVGQQSLLHRHRLLLHRHNILLHRNHILLHQHRICCVGSTCCCTSTIDAVHPDCCIWLDLLGVDRLPDRAALVESTTPGEG